MQPAGSQPPAPPVGGLVILYRDLLLGVNPFFDLSQVLYGKGLPAVPNGFQGVYWLAEGIRRLAAKMTCQNTNIG